MEAKNPAACSCHKTKERSEKEYKDLIHRLNRIEGQVRGIQTAAVTAALNSFSRTLLSSHIHTCVANDIREGNDQVIDELMNTLQKLMK